MGRLLPPWVSIPFRFIHNSLYTSTEETSLHGYRIWFVAKRVTGRKGELLLGEGYRIQSQSQAKAINGSAIYSAGYDALV